MPGTVFVDGSGLIAIVRTNDALHAQAARVFAALGKPDANLMTSEWVLAEFLAGCARQPLRKAAVSVITQLRSSASVTVVPSGRRSFAAAYDLYRSRPDKEWSLVDCASILACRERGVPRVFTHDHHFRQAGLDTLLK